MAIAKSLLPWGCKHVNCLLICELSVVLKAVNTGLTNQLTHLIFVMHTFCSWSKRMFYQSAFSPSFLLNHSSTVLCLSRGKTARQVSQPGPWWVGLWLLWGMQGQGHMAQCSQGPSKTPLPMSAQARRCVCWGKGGGGWGAITGSRERRWGGMTFRLLSSPPL